ncbi:MAG: cysteine desulfurase family protein [Phycisphaerales bacterium]
MIYLDNNATTRPAAGVVEAMGRVLREGWANPSSVHRFGQAARHEVEVARARVAALIGARAREIVFTSGGTEAIDLCVRGVLGGVSGEKEKSGQGEGVGAGGPPAPRGMVDSRPVLVTTRVEHSAVRELAEALEREGVCEVRWLEVDGDGVVRVDRLEGAIDGRVALVSVQWANNETGAVQPVMEVARAARRVGAVFHCDATQWVGKMPVEVWGGDGAAGAGVADLLTFSAHKFHGPKGVGAVWRRLGVGLVSRLVGTQEGGARGGTENVAGIVGMGVAAELAGEWLSEPSRREACARLREEFEARVLELVEGAVVVGPRGGDQVGGVGTGGTPVPRDLVGRIWSTSNIAFPRLEAEALLMLLSERGVCASAGAACSSGSLEPSPVLLAMGVPEEVAHGAVRFSISRETTREELMEAAAIVAACVERLRGSGGSGRAK